jgi:hypothetical protein
MNEDLQYLKLLSIFHYVVGGLAALFACFPIMYIAIGILAIYAPGTMDSEGDAMPVFIGWIFIIIGGGLILLGWAFAVCITCSVWSWQQSNAYLYPLGPYLGFSPLLYWQSLL